MTPVGFQPEFLSLKLRRMRRKRDYQGRLSFHFFDRRMTNLATQRQKKSNQCPEKYCRCLNSAFLHGVEWDRLIVHRTHSQRPIKIYT